MEANVPAMLHPLEDLAEHRDRRGGDFRDAGFEMDRRDETRELHGLQLVLEPIATGERVALVRFDAFRVLHPLHERLVDREMTLRRLADRNFFDVRRAGRQRERRRGEDQHRDCFVHGAHLLDGSGASGGSGRSGGDPRRQ
jgi:hypothetical protein